jgi:CheY-like chemotaxis protein
VTRGATLTKQLLAFSRRAPIRPEVLETAGSIQQAVGLFNRSLRGDIRVELSLGNDLWPIQVDAAQLQLALLNIAINARDAMPEGGLLRVSATNVTLDDEPKGLTGQFVAIRLRDSGMGIPEEVLGRVFEPFFTTKPVGKGTGLGLSQVHGFAQQASGAVTIGSKPKEGTEVTLLLPAASPSRTQQQPDASAKNDGLSKLPCKGLSILVVDDDGAIGRLTVEMLEGAGHRATATTDPRVALEWLANGGQFDVVVSDVIMPGGMSGIDLGREIRRLWADLPILLVTGYAANIDIVQHEFSVLDKPFTALELSRAIETVVWRKRQWAVT